MNINQLTDVLNELLMEYAKEGKKVKDESFLGGNLSLEVIHKNIGIYLGLEKAQTIIKEFHQKFLQKSHVQSVQVNSSEVTQNLADSSKES